MDLTISEISNVRETEAVTQKREASGDFEFTLAKTSDERLMERLHGLIDQITDSGKRLAEHMDVSDMKRYRGLVKDFIGEVTSHSHEFSRENFLDRRGRHRVYGIVRLVDKNLDELAQEILKQEKDHIKILDKTDEIRGLLLDILI
ncbi:MAG: YaaR family protein [Clostridiales bacterium]|jgi:uncharacterized protein YaaR (DUF327 family)|nr:YaaR family protein [Clostridiales bacterium]